MGRLALFLLVLIIVALGARVLFVDAVSTEDATLQTAPKVPTKPIALAPQVPPPAEPATDPLNPITIVDPDPDLDQTSEPVDCPGAPEPLPEPEPQDPPPH